MKLRLTALDPHFLVAMPGAYRRTNDIAAADALQLRCPHCQWENRRNGGDAAHEIILQRDALRRWHFSGHSYRDLSIIAGQVKVGLTAGCGGHFYIHHGMVMGGDE